MFWIIAGAMLALALAFVLTPLLRRHGAVDMEAQRKRRALDAAREAGVVDDREYARKLQALGAAGAPRTAARPLVPVAILALALPAAAVLLYGKYGDPRALDPQLMQVAEAVSADPANADGGAAPDMQQAVAGLAERMRNEPDNLEGWMLLGRAYKTMERFAEAKAALDNAYRLAPDDADVLIEYAEAVALASAQRRIEGEALQLLQRAVAAQPQHQRGLWLLGVAAMQQQDYAEAVAQWEKLMALLPPDGDARPSLQQQIDVARERGGLAAATPAAPAAAAPARPPAAAGPDAPRLTVTVDIAPALKTKVGASDTLFVFARLPQGPRMPLAIQRLSAGALPVTVTLDDSTSMLPDMKLSSMPEVVVGARISKSGQATPQTGDLETLSSPLPSSRREPIALTIDRIVP